MTSYQAKFEFPGLHGIISGNMTFSTGIQPSTCVMQVLPQESPPEMVGTLRLIYGNTQIEFPNCLIDSASFSLNDSGRTVSVSILDRRWMWRFGEITGYYNTRKSDGYIYPDTEKTPQELAELILEAMGESDYDVSQIPNDLRPEIRWSFANPARELHGLAEQVGCRVVLTTENRVVIARKGELSYLTDSGVIDRNKSINPSEIPEKIKVVFGDTQWELAWSTEAVGEDTDGTIKPIDELSYTPDEGWGSEALQNFINTKIEYGENEMSLAKKCVYKWYRFKSILPGPKIKMGGKEYKPDEIDINNVELMARRVEVNGGVASVKKKSEPEEPIAFGDYCKQDDGYENLEGKIIDVGFSVDSEAKIAKFSRSVLLLDETEKVFKPAVVNIITGCRIRKSLKDGFERAYYEQYVGGEYGVRVYEDIDNSHKIISEYDSDYNFAYYKVTDNEDVLVDVAKNRLQIIADEYQQVDSYTAKYEGIVDISPSGSIMQVGWEFGDSGGFTSVSVNSEFDNIVLTENEKRLALATSSQTVTYQLLEIAKLADY